MKKHDSFFIFDVICLQLDLSQLWNTTITSNPYI